MRTMFYRSNAKTFQFAHALRAKMTDAEKILWDRLSNNQLDGYRFKRQHPIANYIADFYCHKTKLIIEVDGKIHEQEKRMAYDKDRTMAIEQLGCRVLRFTNDEVMHQIEDVIAIIRKETTNKPPSTIDKPPLGDLGANRL